MNNEHTSLTHGTRTPVKPGAYLNMRVLDDVNLSPDGKRVAYVVWERIPDQPKRRGSIWLVELVVYPREGHGVSEPKHVIDSEERLLRWLERYS